MSYGMSSILGYTVERLLQQRRGKYKQGNMECLIASEGANNAGTFTQLVPLLFLGIPITASEAIIYNILESRGYPVTIEWFQSTFTQVIIFFLISSSLGLLLAGRYVNILKIIDGLNIRYVYLSILTILFGAIFWMGYQIYAGIDYLIITAALLPLGVLLRKQDTMPLVYGFILHDALFDVGDRILIMYT
jgi:TctA family transporter